MRRSISLVAMASVTLMGCSSRPRTFEPQLAAAPVSQSAYQERLFFCRQQIAAAMDKEGRLASGVGGAAIGAGAGVAAGAATASAMPAIVGAGAAVAGMMVITAPLAAVFGAWGIAKMKRTKKEKVIKAVLGKCLADGGFQVSGYEPLSKKEAKAISAALQQAQPIQSAATVEPAPAPEVDSQPH